jgi:hypothetical protein
MLRDGELKGHIFQFDGLALDCTHTGLPFADLDDGRYYHELRQA